MHKQLLATIIVATFTFGAGSARAVTWQKGCITAGWVTVGVAAAGIVTFAVLLAHFRGSQFVNGLTCGESGTPECCQTDTKGAAVSTNCSVAIPSNPFNCTAGTVGQCLWNGRLLQPTASYTEQASSAQVGTSIALGLSAVAFVFVPLTMVGVWTQCS